MHGTGVNATVENKLQTAQNKIIRYIGSNQVLSLQETYRI